jgi:hypothetical protein
MFCSVSLTALKEMTRTSLGELAHENWIQSYNHMKTTEEQYWRRDGLMREATENIIIIIIINRKV